MTTSRPTEPPLSELRSLQSRLAERVRIEPLEAEPATVAAVDVHLAGERGIAAAVLASLPSLEIVEQQIAVVDITFPYVPGFLSFREAPACLAVLQRLSTAPELILVDGQGLAHPRSFGLACHVGIESEIPTIGVAKSILVGHHGALGTERGSVADLVHRGKIVGVALRTRADVAPLYVSVGHRITLPECVDWVLRTTTRYRLPEPSRQAHRLASEAARELRGR